MFFATTGIPLVIISMILFYNAFVLLWEDYPYVGEALQVLGVAVILLLGGGHALGNARLWFQATAVALMWIMGLSRLTDVFIAVAFFAMVVSAIFCTFEPFKRYRVRLMVWLMSYLGSIILIYNLYFYKPLL